MAGFKVYELTTQGTLLGTDWLVVQRGTDPAKKRSISDILNDVLSVNFNNGYFNGNLGVGTVTPAAKAEIVGGADGVETTLLQLRGDAVGDNTAVGIKFVLSTGASSNIGAQIMATRVGTNGDLTLRVASAATLIDIIKLETTGIDVTGTGDFSGIVTAAGFVPFTGCHIAKSNEDLKLGELVQIKSTGWVNPKQPDWEASYCNGSKKGVYGVVYDIQVIDIMEDYDSEKEVGITKTIKVVEVQKIDGVYTAVEVEREEPVMIEFVVVNTNNQKIKVQKTELKPCVKQRKTGEFTQYLIASVGDGFITVDCACQYGDLLIPSITKGLATVYKGTGYPRNFIGIAGEDSEGEKIAWVKE